jgi:hypothetical protein
MYVIIGVYTVVCVGNSFSLETSERGLCMHLNMILTYFTKSGISLSKIQMVTCLLSTGLMKSFPFLTIEKQTLQTFSLYEHLIKISTL